MAKTVYEIVLQLENGRQVTGQMSKLNTETEKVARSSKGLGNTMQVALGNLAAQGIQLLLAQIANLSRALQDLISQSLEAASAVRAMDAGFQAVLGSTEAAEEELAFVKDLSNELGLEVKGAADAFLQLTAAAQTQNLAQSDIREAFSETSRVLGLLGKSGAESQRVLNALSQVAGKGVVSMEELKLQIGEQLPVALGALANGLNMTVPEVIDLVSSGELLAEDFFPAFSRGLQEIEGQIDPSILALNRFKNAIFELQAGLGEELLPLRDSLLSFIQEVGSLTFEKIDTSSLEGARGALEDLTDLFENNQELVEGLSNGLARLAEGGLSVLEDILGAVKDTLEDPEVITNFERGVENLAIALEAVGEAAVGLGKLLQLLVKIRNATGAAFVERAALLVFIETIKVAVKETGNLLSRMRQLLAIILKINSGGLVDISAKAKTLASDLEGVGIAARDAGVLGLREMEQRAKSFQDQAEETAEEAGKSFEELSKEVESALKRIDQEAEISVSLLGGSDSSQVVESTRIFQEATEKKIAELNKLLAATEANSEERKDIELQIFQLEAELNTKRKEANKELQNLFVEFQEARLAKEEALLEKAFDKGEISQSQFFERRKTLARDAFETRLDLLKKELKEVEENSAEQQVLLAEKAQLEAQFIKGLDKLDEEFRERQKERIELLSDISASELEKALRNREISEEEFLARREQLLRESTQNRLQFLDQEIQRAQRNSNEELALILERKNLEAQTEQEIQEIRERSSELRLEQLNNAIELEIQGSQRIQEALEIQNDLVDSNASLLSSIDGLLGDITSELEKGNLSTKRRADLLELIEEITGENVTEQNAIRKVEEVRNQIKIRQIELEQASLAIKKEELIISNQIAQAELRREANELQLQLRDPNISPERRGFIQDSLGAIQAQSQAERDRTENAIAGLSGQNEILELTKALQEITGGESDPDLLEGLEEKFDGLGEPLSELADVASIDSEVNKVIQETSQKQAEASNKISENTQAVSEGINSSNALLERLGTDFSGVLQNTGSIDAKMNRVLSSLDSLIRAVRVRQPEAAR